MRLFTMLSWVTVPLGAWAIVPFGFFQQSGHTKLLGTSFGILGQNAAYDYVVCLSTCVHAHSYTDLLHVDCWRRHIRLDSCETFVRES